MAKRIGRQYAQRTVTNGATPRGPSMEDDANERGTFSEIGPAETVYVGDRRVFLFDANDQPLTRKAGF